MRLYDRGAKHAWLATRRVRAALVAVVLLPFAAFSLWTAREPLDGPARLGRSDDQLYQAVIESVQSGTPYYEAAASEHRQAHYPLRPFITVRPPLLAVTMAALPDQAARGLALATLAILTISVWLLRFARLEIGKIQFSLSAICLGSGTMFAFADVSYAYHEVWAGLLIALSLGLWRPDGWSLSLLTGLLAALIRELAAPYLIAMAVLAWCSGGRREALAWLLALGVFAIALFLHATAVHQHVVSSDLQSNGWVRFGGWRFVLQAMSWNPLFFVFPQ